MQQERPHHQRTAGFHLTDLFRNFFTNFCNLLFWDSPLQV